MKVSKVIVIVVALHVLVIGGIFVFEGCSRNRVQGPDLVQDQTLPEQLSQPALPELPDGDSLAQLPDTLLPAVPGAAVSTLPTMEPAEMVPTQPLTTTYTVKKGDSLWKIANSEGITVAQLAQANGIDKKSILSIGQTLTIPGKAPLAPAAIADGGTELVSTTTTDAPLSSGETYTVQRGDSLWKIARQHNTSVSALKRANGLSGDMLKPGQQLQLPSAAATASASTAAATPAPTIRAAAATTGSNQDWYEPGTTLTQNGRTVHIVDFNDSLGAIAARYGISVQQLMAENGITDARNIHPGSPLTIPAGPATAPSPAGVTATDAALAAPIVSAPATVN